MKHGLIRTIWAKLTAHSAHSTTGGNSVASTPVEAPVDTLAKTPSETPTESPAKANSDEGKLTITSDVQGTLLLAANKYNLGLFKFLMDAANAGHRVIITSTGSLDLMEDTLWLAAQKLKVTVPENIELISKFELFTKVTKVDIGFDDLDFRYLPEELAPRTPVIIDAGSGKPSVPFSELKNLANIKDDDISPFVPTQSPSP